MRRREFETALARAGVRAPVLLCFGCPDQEAAFRIARVARKLATLFQRFRIATVFTHPYEGGHPDHDACAAAVQFARTLIREDDKRPALFEFASYHASANGGMESERFVRNSRKTWQRTLNDEQRRMKSDLISAYTSQQRTLCGFPLCEEPVRISPAYDFTKPPHRGKLYYENFDWGVNGHTWRRLARCAMKHLGIVPKL
jgi:LmbE family N-acetylglucosaminyl deacetylase